MVLPMMKWKRMLCGLKEPLPTSRDSHSRRNIGLAVACSEAEHVERAGRVHLELCECNRFRTEILGHGREGAIRHKGWR